MTSHAFRPALAAAAILALSAPAWAAGPQQINLVERATSDAVLDTGTQGDSAGDILTFANEVYDEANTAKAGDNNGWCIRTVVGKAWECFWTLTLAGGQITVEGPFLDGKDSVLAVTGGTREYAGARGDMQLHSRNAAGTEYDFKYSLTD